MIINHFKAKNDVTSDGIYVISALSSCIKKKFLRVLDDFWPYLHLALSKTNDAELFKTSVGCLADIARACDDDFVSKLDIMEELLKYLSMP